MLFNRNIEPSCAYCRFSMGLGSGEFVCSKRGIVAADNSCSSFKYEPTKRVPEPQPRIKVPSLDAQELSL